MRNIKTMVLISITAVFFISCHKDDEIDIHHLVGEWSVVNTDPTLVMDGLIRYTFNEDKSCTIYSADALSTNDTTLYRTYIISNNHEVITLVNEEKRYTEQYYIRKLTATEMKWENTTPKDGNVDKVLSKIQKKN